MLGLDLTQLEALGTVVRDRQVRPRPLPPGRQFPSGLAQHGIKRGLGPHDLWNLDTAVAGDMLTVLVGRESEKWLGGLGLGPEIELIWSFSRGSFSRGSAPFAEGSDGAPPRLV